MNNMCIMVSKINTNLAHGMPLPGSRIPPTKGCRSEERPGVLPRLPAPILCHTESPLVNARYRVAATSRSTRPNTVTSDSASVEYLSPGLRRPSPLPWVPRPRASRTLKRRNNRRRRPLRPGGAPDNSPAFQRWVPASHLKPSPVGTAETRRHQ